VAREVAGAWEEEAEGAVARAEAAGAPAVGWGPQLGLTRPAPGLTLSGLTPPEVNPEPDTAAVGRAGVGAELGCSPRAERHAQSDSRTTMWRSYAPPPTT